MTGGVRPKTAKRARYSIPSEKGQRTVQRTVQRIVPPAGTAKRPPRPEFYEEIKGNTILLPVYNALKCLEMDDEQIEILMTCLEPYFTHLERVIISEKFYEDLFKERLIETYTFYIEMTLTEFKDYANKFSRDTREFEKEYYPFDKLEDPTETRWLVVDGDEEGEIDIPSCGLLQEQGGGGKSATRRIRRKRLTGV